MKNLTLPLIIVLLFVSCSDSERNQDQDLSNSLVESLETETEDTAEEDESYWNKIKTWTSDSYKSSKEWVSEKWPDAKNWGEGAIEKISKMATDLGDEMKKVEINAFSLEDDKSFGKELYDEIHNSPSEYTVMSRSVHQSEYNRIENIVKDILESGEVKNAEAFDWTVTLIDDDETVNAMCAPGGYIFVYTGLLDFVDNDSELAGILAHEIAHADKRHGTRQLTTVYGVQFLIAFLTDNDSEVGAQIAAGLLNLKHSRDHERQADEYSVKYLCNTSYDANGVAQFFSKFEQSGNALEELISTHPDHQERIENVNTLKIKLNCK